MKYLFIVLVLGSLAIVSCSKPVLPANGSEKFVGKWKYFQSYYSIGGPLIYNSTESLGQWIEFKADGSFASNMPKFEKVIQYEKLDSLKVKFITSAPRSESRYFVFLDSTDQSLSVSSADNICIEGCGDKFRKEQL